MQARSTLLKAACTWSLGMNEEPVSTVVLPTIPLVGLIVSTAPANGSRKLEPGEAEELGAIEGGFEWREEPTAAFEPPTVTVKVWLVELAVEPIAVADACEPPDDDAGDTTSPSGPRAAAPSMMIDTTMANPTARLRGDRTCAFIGYLGGGFYGPLGHPLRERVRGTGKRLFVRRESC